MSFYGVIMKKRILSVLLILFVVIGITGCVEESSSTGNDTGNNSTSGDSSTTETKIDNYGLGDTITFDGLELTFDTTYSFVTIDNRFSDKNGNDVIKLGVNVKNVSSDTNSLNMFFYTLFGSQGTELTGVASYFDDAIDFAGSLKPDASYKTYFYILYDGDGKYSIDFDNYSEQLSVEFDVAK